MPIQNALKKKKHWQDLYFPVFQESVFHLSHVIDYEMVLSYTN